MFALGEAAPVRDTGEVSTRILLVEDDHGVAAGLVRELRRAGFDVELATDGARGAELATTLPFALVVLDLMLPERDGFDVLRLIRARTAVPVIVVTARTELRDRLKAFELGAVDYVPKPFFFDELLARIHARIGAPAPPHQVIETALARIDLSAPRIEVGGAAVHLTPTELALLRYLADRRGRAVSRGDLAAALRDLDDADPRNIDAHMSRLRKKLGPAAALIATVWGHGYRFDPHAADGAA